MLMSLAEDVQKGKLRGDLQQTEYKAVFGELTWTKGVLLKGTQLVLPKTLWAEVIALAHGGHQHCQAGPCLPGRGKGSQASIGGPSSRRSRWGSGCSSGRGRQLPSSHTTPTHTRSRVAEAGGADPTAGIHVARRVEEREVDRQRAGGGQLRRGGD